MEREKLEELKSLIEELCKKGKAYRAKRMRAGEKSSAYLSGRAVKVCKGQMQGEGDESEGVTDDDMLRSFQREEQLNALGDIISKYVKDPDGVDRELDLFDNGGFDNMSDVVTANLLRDDEYKAWASKYVGDEKVMDEEIEAEDDTEFTVSLKHLLDKHVDKGGEIEEIDALHENEEYCPKCATKIKKAIREEIEKVAKEDYKPSLRAYNVIDKSNNDEIVAKELSYDRALEKAHTNPNYKIKATQRLAKEAKTKPAKGKRFAKKVKNPKTGRTRTVSYGQAGKAKKGGDRIRPGTAKGNAYCARSAKIKKCKNPPCANTLSRKKWKCQGSRSVK